MTQPNPVVVKALQQALVDLTDLSLQAKQAHWNIAGSGFRALHLHLDERMTAIQAIPDGRAATVAADSQVEPIDGGVLPTDKATVMIQERLEGVANRIKATLDEVDEYDHLSNDMLIGIATGLEKHAWMLRVSAEEQA